MKLIIHANEDVSLAVDNFDQWTLIPMLEDLNDPETEFIQLDVEGDQVYMNKHQIIQITVKKEEEDVRST